MGGFHKLAAFFCQSVSHHDCLSGCKTSGGDCHIRAEGDPDQVESRTPNRDFTSCVMPACMFIPRFCAHFTTDNHSGPRTPDSFTNFFQFTADSSQKSRQSINYFRLPFVSRTRTERERERERTVIMLFASSTFQARPPL